MLVQVFERRIDRLPWQPPDFFEEVLEFVAAIYIFVGLAARQRIIMSRMSVRPLIGIMVLALGLSACRGEFPASAASQEKSKPQAPAAGSPAREVSVVPAAERVPAADRGRHRDPGRRRPGHPQCQGCRPRGVHRHRPGHADPRGQPLARLDQTDFKLRVEQAEAALQQARARLGLTPSGKDEQVDPEQTSIVRQARAVLDEARLTRDRSVKLLEQQLIARSQLDTAEANLQVADGRYQDALEEVRNRQAVLAQRRSELDLARQQLTDTVVLAPIDGAVSQRLTSRGEYLAVGAPMATLVRIHPLRLRVSVPERESSGVRVGQIVRLTIEGDPTVYSGRVVRLAPIVQSSIAP